VQHEPNAANDVKLPHLLQLEEVSLQVEVQRYPREGMLLVNFCQPSHEFTFVVGMNFISYPLVLTPWI
jgi:hypothetical protein